MQRKGLWAQVLNQVAGQDGGFHVGAVVARDRDQGLGPLDVGLAQRPRVVGGADEDQGAQLAVAIGAGVILAGIDHRDALALAAELLDEVRSPGAQAAHDDVIAPEPDPEPSGLDRRQGEHRIDDRVSGHQGGQEACRLERRVDGSVHVAGMQDEQLEGEVGQVPVGPHPSGGRAMLSEPDET